MAGATALTTAVEGAAETEAAATRQGLRQVGGGAPGRREGGGFVRLNRGNRGRSSGGGQGGRRDGARGCPQDSYSSYSSSTADSSADQGEVKVVAVKRQATPFPVDIASSAERLTKLTVTDDRTKPVSSDLARARTSAITTAASTAKTALDGLGQACLCQASPQRRSSQYCAAVPCILNAFTTGNPFGEKLRGISIGRGLGFLKGVYQV